MLTKVPNANCFSRVRAFFWLIILFPTCFTLSSQASSAADRERDRERQPLLVNEHRDRADHVEVRLEEGLDHKSLQQYLADLNMDNILTRLDPIVVAADLLVKKESATAEAEMDKITTYMYYVSDPDFHEQIKEEARQGAYYVQDSKAFQQLLLDRALKAATEGPLTTYLPELNEIILSFQNITPRLQQRVIVLIQRVDILARHIQIIKQKHARETLENQRQLGELRKSNKRLWIALPVVAVITAGVVGSIAAFLGHAYWH